MFGRFRIAPPVFLHGEVEYLSDEYLRFDLSTERKDLTSVLLGAGVSWPAGRRLSVFALGLYNLAYDDADPSPHGSPWLFGPGVGFGF